MQLQCSDEDNLPELVLQTLSALYNFILSEAVKDDDGYVSAEYAYHLHDILEVVIYAQAPITPEALSDILCMHLDDLDAYLAPLHSVLVVPDAHSANEVVRPLHQSFPDFVRQQGDIVHPMLAMDYATAHKNVAERCFFQLNKLLHSNMCGIKDASLCNHEVPDLPARLIEHVSAALLYSCRYGLTHLLEHIRIAGSQSQVPCGLFEFCEEHLLHWIELLSLMGDLDKVKENLSELITVTIVRIVSIPTHFRHLTYYQEQGCLSVNMELHSLLNDVYCLLTDYQVPITTNALHVYHSGVVSMPECALRRQGLDLPIATLISERSREWQSATADSQDFPVTPSTGASSTLLSPRLTC
jgi:hypothetical protein